MNKGGMSQGLIDRRHVPGKVVRNGHVHPDAFERGLQAQRQTQRSVDEPDLVLAHSFLLDSLSGFFSTLTSNCPIEHT